MTNIDVMRSSNLRNCCRCGVEFLHSGGGRICATCKSPKPGKRPLNPKLSFREQQVVSLVAAAKLNKEIAFELHLSEGTIKEYLNRIFKKLGMSNRTELAVWTITNGTTKTDQYVD